VHPPKEEFSRAIIIEANRKLAVEDTLLVVRSLDSGEWQALWLVSPFNRTNPSHKP